MIDAIEYIRAWGLPEGTTPRKRDEKRSVIMLPEWSRRVNNQRRKRHSLSSVSYFPATSKNRVLRRKLPEGYHSRYYARRAVAAQTLRQRDPQPVKVHVHADLLKITYTDAAKGLDDNHRRGGGIRGTVAGFSRASRKRMFEFMASVRNTGSMLFLTMTFDDTTAVNSDDWMLACFETFRKRFERAYPHCRALWRKEWQDRKSGDYEGMFVPHYHLLIFTGVHYEKCQHESVSEAFSAWAKDAWHEITSSTDENHIVYGAHVTPVRSRRHAYNYIGKYIGKQESNSLHTGRAWGRIGTFDCTASETFALDADEYIVLRRLIKKWLKTRAQVPSENASPEEVEKWLLRNKRQCAYARRFARGLSTEGCTVFGLGDGDYGGQEYDIFAGYWQFIAECRRQVADRHERERGYGN